MTREQLATRLHTVLAWAAPLILGLALAYVWSVAPGAIAVVATGSAGAAVLIAWVVLDYRQLRFRRRWARLLLEYRDAAIAANSRLAELEDTWLASALPCPEGPKMTRETLCAAQAAVSRTRAGAPRREEHVRRLQALIDACDVHRPLGPDGKHGVLHTPTCGCESPASDQSSAS